MPGFFGKQSIRLLREMGNWTADWLAQELFAMFGSDVPMETDQPVVLKRDDPAQPAIRIIDNTDGSTPPVVIVRDNEEEPYDPGEWTPPQTGGGGSQPPESASTFIGRILSGSGDTYQVALYENGVTSGATTAVTAYQLQILSTAIIPSGTWAAVHKVGGNYYMQVPVWL